MLACSAGWADCNGSAADGCESHTLADHDHCGTCGKSCSAMAVCLSGKCEANCGTLTDCSGSCVNTASDPKNCGACGNACEASETCSSGSCKCASSSLTKCGGACVNLMTDKQNCGVCGKQCTGVTAQCLSGVCSLCNCQTGLTCCGTSCANLASDANNCGTCSNVCGAGKLCQGGGCVAACGGEGQACCSSNACNAGYRCTATLDQSSALAADWQAGCVRCGGSGEVACLSGSTPACNPSSGLTVYWDTHLKLHLCLDPSGSGGPGEKCSVGVPGTCYDGGYACVTLAATPDNDWCLRCGVFDHVCCAGQQCQTGLSCKFKNNYLCKP
ncbi:MAG: hypothetical protein IT375_10620 [Polyangiaceae bacterium]|nr:hypothetical protein [Polyangiaceae bacterium]